MKLLLLLILSFSIPFVAIAILWGVVIVIRMVKKGESLSEALRALKEEYREMRARRVAHQNLRPGAKGGRFSKSKSLFSPAEREFHKALIAALPDVAIFAKVRVADVVHAKERFNGDFLRISQKHFDWLICHPESFEPLIAVELDDSSHRTNQRQITNDATKNDIALDADLKLLRFAWQSQYDPEKLRETIVNEINAIADRS